MFDQDSSTVWFGPMAAFLSAVTWAIATAAYSRLAKGFSGPVVNTSRAFVALPLAAVWLVVSAGGLSAAYAQLQTFPSGNFQWLTLSIFFGMASGDVFFLLSTKRVGIPTASAIASTYPLWSAVAGWLFDGQLLSHWKLVGLIATVAGTIIVILSGRQILETDGQEAAAAARRGYTEGIVMAMVASLLWALNAFATGQGGKGLGTPEVAFVRLSLALVMCPLVGMIAFRKPPGLLPPRQLLRAAPIFAVEGFGGMILYLYGLTHSPLAVAAALSAMSPPISACVAWALRWERFSLMKLVGILLGFGGTFLLLI